MRKVKLCGVTASRAAGSWRSTGAKGAARSGFGRADLEEQLVAAQRHLLELGQPGEELAQFAPAHGALLFDAVTALREDVKLAGLRQEFNFDSFAHVRPRLCDARRFQLAQQAFGCAEAIGRASPCTQSGRLSRL
jgi:hypothetical protein